MRQIFIIVLLCFIKTYSQTNTNYDLPNILPPTMETFKLSTYGLDFNNSPSGEFKHTIPIFNLDGISMPINLSYNSGVKVDDIGGDVGMSWQLLAGGAITRIVRDEPDESAVSSWFPETVDPDTDKEAIKNAAHPDNSIDTEHDWFSFSLSNGLSGQFYIDNNLNVTYKGGDALKIYIVDKTTVMTLYGRKLEFILIDNQGNKYYFGGDDKFLERTRVNYKGADKYYTSGWYISKIETNTNEMIEFDYNINSIEYYSSLNASFNITEICCGVENFSFESSPVLKSKTTINSLKPQLRTIQSKTALVIFGYNKERKDLINTTAKLLTDITIKNIYSSSTVDFIENFTLGYTDQNAGNAVTYYQIPGNEKSTTNRHFLSSVTELKTGQNYIFEYYNLQSLPPRFSLSSDHYGYYNGKSNLTPFAKVSANSMNSFAYNKIPVGAATADKEVDPSKVYYGNIKRIYYPTGGYSQIVYESNSSSIMVKEKKYIKSDLEAQLNCTDGVKTVTKVKEFDSTGGDIGFGLLAPIVIPNCLFPDDLENRDNEITQILTIHDITINPNNPILLRSINIVNASLGSNSDIPACVDYGNVPKCPTNAPFSTVQGRRYRVSYTLRSRFGSKIDEAMASISYNEYFEDKEVLAHYGGSRVQRIDYMNNEGITYSKKYYYTQLKDINSSKTSIKNPSEIKLFDFIQTKKNCSQQCTGADGYGKSDIDVYRFYKNNIVNDFNDRSNKIFYEYITEVEDNYKANEKKYHYDYDIDPYHYIPTIYDAPKGNFGELKRGLLHIDNNYAFKNNKFELLNNKENFYDFNYYSIPSYIFRQNYSLDGIITQPAEGPIPNISYTMYDNYYGFSKLVGSITKDYSNGIELVTNVETNYANNQHNQLTDQKTIFPDGSSQLTNYQYAHEKPNQKMIDANMVGIPLITETTKTANNVTKTIAKTETIYPTVFPDAQTGNLLLPKSASSLDLLTGVMATDVTYNQYDIKGNLLQYTTKSGITTAIVWGYNNTQPIAKIEGATYSQVSSLAATMVTASDTDASAGVNNDETSLLDLMKTFREALSNYQVTTYTYDPLVGVRSITPPNGIRQVYIYDTANRLKEVRENSQSGNLLKEYQYNYKH